MGDNGADLISELPDELLLHIFSFLDVMVVVRSSVLSRRWRYLWTLVSVPAKMEKDRIFYMDQRKHYHRLHEIEARICHISRSISHTLYSITALYLWICLPLFFMLEFKYFACINIGMTLLSMRLIGLEWYRSWSSMFRGEASFKKLQKIDFRLTSQINSISTNSPLVKPLLPVNFQPKYALTKSYALFGMLVVMIISCSLTILSWKFELGTMPPPQQ